MPNDEVITTPERALAVIWAGRDSLLEPDICEQIAAVFHFKGRLPLKGVEQLRREGVWLEKDKNKTDIGGGVTLIQSFLPEGCITAELVETITGVGPPTVLTPHTDIPSSLNWRTQRALRKGFNWKPNDQPGWIYD